MAMGIVSDEEFNKELDSNQAPEMKVPEVMPLVKPGRNKGDNNVPDSLRKIIGETSVIDGRQEALALARDFGISPSSVSAYANGSTSTDSMDKTPNKNHLNNAKERISKRARLTLRKALLHITDDKLSTTKAVELAQIAKSMSGVIKDMEPDNPGPNNGKMEPQFIVYSPQLHVENNYEVIHSKE
jgi:hypothetical protein